MGHTEIGSTFATNNTTTTVGTTTATTTTNITTTINTILLLLLLSVCYNVATIIRIVAGDRGRRRHRRHQ